ncbi:uncharacterized protein KY384_003056 [Bacidia gigantensis]|uniref:uncharacterized protein n=1 Tax=Bacidia gigantensis TaxID=2732470 RepID=UPI001D04118A|nr:uncharacterized protein KY384_003056 [Bacidia gigantensis]KAG8531427.1 hypothetical protein KY384_003056 [Bacidia gigantensis]
MSGRFVRASKYRHVFGQTTKKEQCYNNIKISGNAWDTNLVKANPQYLSVNWEAGGGGAFAVIPLSEKGRLPDHIPLFRGHTAVVLDTDWSPFNDSFLASASDDGKVGLWKVPEDFAIRTDDEEELKDIAPVKKLTGHSKKVGHVLFNPSADQVLATSSGDYTVKIWDVEAGKSKLTLNVGDIIQSLTWSANGSLLATTSRDKKLRIWDTRQQKPAHEGAGHGGTKASRAVWLGENDRIATTGFSRMSDRQLALWDIRQPAAPKEGFERLDTQSGICMPFWDDGTQMLYLAGKGDGNIRYFELQNDKLEFLSEYKSVEPQRGVAFLPKRGVNIREKEVMRAYKTVGDNYVEPISFFAPRRAEGFQADIYPPTVGSKPAMSSAEWFGGKEALPPKIDLESVYNGEEPAEASTTDTPFEKPAPEPAPKAPSPITKSVEPEPEPAAESAPPTALKGPPPSMTEQTASIKDLAAKYDDNEEDDVPDEESSFEEVAKPIERPIKQSAAPTSDQSSQMSPTTRSLGDSLSAVKDKPDDFAQASQMAASQSTEAQIKAQAKPLSETKPEPLREQLPPSRSVSGQQQPEVHESLAEIKSLLEQQNRTMNAQNETIGKLTAEVDRLRTRIGE